MSKERIEGTETERRALAQKNRGRIVPGSGHAVEPRKLDQMVSLRLDPEVLSELRRHAERLGRSLSDVLREAAVAYLETLQVQRVTVNFTSWETGSHGSKPGAVEWNDLMQAFRSTYSELQPESQAVAISKTA